MVCETGILPRAAAIALAIVATYFGFNAEGRRAAKRSRSMRCNKN
jgi:hypothetical protein